MVVILQTNPDNEEHWLPFHNRLLEYTYILSFLAKYCITSLLFCRYSSDYGMFHFCIADTEHDWREGSEQYKFIERCPASADRRKQPWLIFAAHRALGYSSDYWYGLEGSFEEPMGRESLQKLWQKYKVDIAFFGHVHNYERTCPIYQVLSNFEDILVLSLSFYQAH